MNLKHFTQLLLAFLFACSLPLLALDAKNEDDGSLKLERPDKCPKIDDVRLEAARRNKNLKELIASHDEIMGIYRELEASRTLAEGGDKKSEKNVDKLEKKLERARRQHERIAEKIKKPWVKEYNKLWKKYSELQKKGEAASAQNNEKRAQKFFQEAQTFTGTMEGMKTNIDYVDYFSFFQGYDDGKKDEPKDNKPVIQGDKEDPKDAKKGGKKKKKDKPNE
ncbi:MAG: hypothetical protein IKP00_14710 [Victivallales bacterium]|nr:hypothetical protein [Victivallales bacterium]